MNYNIILIILGSLLAGIQLGSCSSSNRHSGADENKTEAVANIADTSALIEVEDFVDPSATIDSCVIIYDNFIEPVRFTVKPEKCRDSTSSYGCRLSMSGYKTPSSYLECGGGDYIIRSVDSLFVRKLVPPIISEKCDSDMITCGDFPRISFKIFIGGKYIYKEYVFAEKHDHYTYEFSDCFYELCDMIRFNSSNYISEYYYKDKSVIRWGSPSWAPPGEKEDGAYINVEQMPEFPDGDGALLKLVHDNIRYPAAAKESGLLGRVIVRFVVTKDGSVGKVKVMRSKGPILDEEAIRVVKSLPKFIPGKRRGKAVDVWYTLPVTFKLDSSVK